ncbi:MAG TPA: phosphoribosyl 1,2-cyclic phosphodiesterase [Rhodobacteraceae bacterium]|nr:phosphoribosyl 1,2-cyclic phosphodiesterase [Paracoccaceae bacterium]
MARLSFTILGCGSSGGVPRIGGHWGECNPNNPKNARRRCSLLVTRETDAGQTRVLIDTSPDLRTQLLDADVSELDAVVFTHAHADHVHGLDDLRQVVYNIGRRLPVWADGATQDALLGRFGYAFVQPAGSSYPPILDLHTISGDVSVEGAGGVLTLHPFEVEHGVIDSLGFRIGDLAYLPDVSAIKPEAWPLLDGLAVFIIDALRRQPHPTHANLETALAWLEQSGAERGVLTNMHIDLDYDDVAAETPAHVTPAYDGMTFSFDV